MPVKFEGGLSEVICHFGKWNPLLAPFSPELRAVGCLARTAARETPMSYTGRCLAPLATRLKLVAADHQNRARCFTHNLFGIAAT
jgi:hypothetical protein